MKRFAKRLLVGIVALVMVVGISAGILFYHAGQTGSGSIETWIASQLQTITNSYINPTLSFTDLDYQYPGTVRLKQLRLTATDAASGQTIDILGAGEATVTLGEIPQVGKPIVIEKIVLNRPLIQAVAIAPGAKQFVGFTDFVKQEVIEAVTQPVVESPATAPATKIDKTKLSDVFQMRLVELIDGKIVYDPRIAGTDPMVLDQINTRLDITPDQAGAYAMKMKLARAPLFAMDVGLLLNLDTAVASDIKINVDASVGRGKDDYLPPQLQELLKKHQVRGDITIRVRGQLPLTDYKNGDVLVTAELSDANVTAGEYKVPIKQFVLQAKLAEGRVLLPVAKLDALQGNLSATGQLTLNDTLDSELKLTVADMVIDELFVTPGTADDPKLAGRVNANINAAVPLAALLPRLAPPTPQPPSLRPIQPPMPEQWGGGEIHLDRGRLVKLPVIGELTSAIIQGSRLFGGKPKPVATEKVDTTFTFQKDVIRLSDFNYLGDLVAARGVGTISLDRKLDLTVNGGPIEKVQSLLGKQVGGLIGKVTDQLVGYRVTGTTDEPKIAVNVGGNDLNKTLGDGAKGLGDGVGNILKGVTGK